MSEGNLSDETQMEVDEDPFAAREVDLAEMEPDMGHENHEHNMDFLLDIPLEITVELGNANITIGELLKLSQGSVVELNKLTNEPLDILVNKKLMAHGEVVVVNEKFGIRLTNIVSPGERVKGLS